MSHRVVDCLLRHPVQVQRHKWVVQLHMRIDLEHTVVVQMYTGVLGKLLQRGIDAAELQRHWVEPASHRARHLAGLSDHLSDPLQGLGQLLTSLSLMCASVQQRLLARAQPEAEAEAEAMQRVTEVIAQASEMTRSVARGLYPVALEFGGINAALEQLAEHTRAHLRHDCVFEVDPYVQLQDPQVALNLYRVAQEAVNNAVKHGRAGQIRIALARVGSEHRLSISDDGRGLPSQATGGLGLASMRFRARQLGGRLEIEPCLPRGTTVSVSYPS